ncbi:thiamine phosphate synthase [Vibrio paucivorans]|uniref:Thiamine-phosphate synthase n=1 Tax=Vibrio paucivorans TaxID=2829489 RepID=A0A9X3HSG6_9VIBR|nr:thiamine phosphate synthase [Vibrio paucivorans]MCW8334813.1 thiamine phosphate synthase [Vibrio paucivorans]
MKILIPPQNINLTGEIQQCLLVAKSYGFAIEDIELGVSSTPYLEVGLEGQLQTIGIKRSHQCHTSDSHQDVLLDYSIERFDTLLQRNVVEPRHIYINVEFNLDLALGESVKNTTHYLDVWRGPTSQRAIQSASTISENEIERHSSWVVALLALDFPIEDALMVARAAMNVSRETWPTQFEDYPTPILELEQLGIHVGWGVGEHSIQFPQMAKEKLGLYPVVDSVEWIEALLRMGVKTVQLRIKNSELSDLEHQISKSIRLGREYNAQVFINDYWQLAIKHGAYGVHLGQEDIEESNLVSLSQAGIKLGLSTHGYYELMRICQISPSYIALGHIFPTTTKEMPSKPQGLVRLKLYQQLIDTIPYHSGLGFPTVAIGGIDSNTAPQVWECGVTSLAVVRAITLADQPQQVVDWFNSLINKPQSCIDKEKQHVVG